MKAPHFLRETPLLLQAFDLACRAHEGPDARDDTPIEHPLEVTGILHEHGYEGDVLAAGLLHDVVEDSVCDLADVTRRFGEGIGTLVATMTEDARLSPYEARKADHRRRVSAGGPDVAAIFGADKLAKVRELTRAGKTTKPRKLDHYERSLRMLQRDHPEIPFLPMLESELADYRRSAPALAAR